MEFPEDGHVAFAHVASFTVNSSACPKLWETRKSSLSPPNLEGTQVITPGPLCSCLPYHTVLMVNLCVSLPSFLEDREPIVFYLSL